MAVNISFIETCVGLMKECPDQLIALRLKLEEERDTAIQGINVVNEALRELDNDI